MTDIRSDRSGESRPNVVLITAHDLGQHLGCYGVETIESPNLDTLADRGVRFENACSTTPVCSPSRWSLHTGRYPQSNGLLGLTHQPWWWRLNDGEETIPELLGEAGYETHLAGIQHIAPHASRLSFDHRHQTDHDAEQTAAAAPEIFESADGPFYAQFGFQEVHRTYEQGQYDERGVYVPGYLQKTEEIVDDLARFQAEINYLDEQVGDVLNALEESGYREETVVLFTTEHGIPYPGAKCWCRSPGVEIATIADGPGPAFSERETVDAVFSNVDILPTLFDVLDVPIPERVEGVSFRDYLAGETDDPPREFAFTQYTAAGSEARGVIGREFNLIRNFGAGRPVEYPVDTDPTDREGSTTWEPRPYAQLYDRKADPYELDDVADEHPDVVERLSNRVRSWMVDVDDPVLRGGIRYPYNRRAVGDLLSGQADR